MEFIRFGEVKPPKSECLKQIGGTVGAVSWANLFKTRNTI